MAVSPGQPDALRDLRDRAATEGGVFWVDDDVLAIFDPAAAQAVNAKNFADLVLPEKLSDLLRRREGEKIRWQEVREAWLGQMRRLSEKAELEKLAARMASLLDERAGSPRDLVWLAQEVISRALLPTVIDGLSPAAIELVLRDQTFKIGNVMATGPPLGWWKSTTIQLRAGWAVRRELQGRAAGRRPRRLDLTDPIADMLPRLGIGRAVDAVTGVLTAIGGPPGGAGACLIYALERYPEEAREVEDELRAIELSELCAAPTRLAPATHRFVREVLRLWSPTAIAGRQVRHEIEHPGISLKPGQEYLLSPDMLHHDPKSWPEPNRFDPGRWLPDASRCPHSAAAYTPFGWAPRACIGAGLGMSQLILFCHLLRVAFRVEVPKPEALAMALPSMPVPQNLFGSIVRVPAT